MTTFNISSFVTRSALVNPLRVFALKLLLQDMVSNSRHLLLKIKGFSNKK